MEVGDVRPPSAPRRGLGRGLEAILPARGSYGSTDPVNAEANRDPLTGLCDRPVLTGELDRVLAEAGAERSSVAVLVFGLSGFRHLNAVYGHDTGDRVLQELGRRLAGNGRSMDLVARLGGDEFAVVYPRVGADVSPERLVARLSVTVEKTIVVDGAEHRLTAVTGVVVSTPDVSGGGAAARSLLRSADLAMQQARDEGRSWAAQESGGPASDPPPRYEVPPATGSASACYAPVMELRRLAVGGVVLLAGSSDTGRPDAGSPDTRRPDESGADESDLRAPALLTSARSPEVLDHALFDLSGWMSDVSVPDGFRVWIATHARDLAQQDVTEALELLPAKYGVPGEMVGVALTAAASGGEMADAVRSLHSLGMSVAVDPSEVTVGDLWMLFDLPLHAVWMSLDDVVDDRGPGVSQGKREAVTRGLTALARDVGVAVVASDVFDLERARLLRSLGCTHGWGLAFGQSLVARDVERMLRSGR